ncbi:AGC/PDK1 protein kinase [Kwoniella heveanensis CBS 569]|nr:AGC/PDK1 protein kinase [Kwoniella heveanensis CBS 569]
MATIIRPSPVPTPPASSPPTPPTNYPTFPRLSSPSIQRNASTSSSRSTTTVSSTSSLQAAPMRPPPIETSTAATSRSQLPSRAESETESERNLASSAYSPDRGTIGGRNWGRNGPRSGRMGITTPSRSPPPILNTAQNHRPSTSGSTATTSPTTPRQPRHLLVEDPSSVSPQGPLRVTISMDPMDHMNHDHRSVSPPSDPSSPITARGREGHLTAPSSPTVPPRAPALMGNKQRTLSVDGGNHRPVANGRRSGSMDRQTERERERRQSQVSNHSHSGSGQIKKPSIRDFVLGEELGQGSYSTVFAATAAASSSNNQSPSSPKPPRKYAIKIINQHHLVQEKKVKYAMIERDALVRLSTPRTTNSPTTRSHRRGLSSSSSAGYPSTPAQVASKRRSVASIGGSSSAGVGASVSSSNRKDSGATIIPNSRDRLSIVTTDSNGSSSPILGGTPLSPVTKNFAGRRPSRSAELPESVPEQTEMLSPEDPTKSGTGTGSGTGKSRPPSPVTEEPLSDHLATPPQPSVPRVDQSSTPTPGYATPEIQGSPMLGGSEPQPRSSRDGRTPKKRRQSLAPSERSVKSSSGKTGQAHPGVIRLHSTFNDSTSLYFVLDMASNGELATFIRKHGSLDLNSARYYAAQLIDTIEFMHEKGVVHRDLKPENILLDDDMRIKITDFGSAKLVSKEEETVEDGKKRSFVGSADFVSPEVLRNEPASAASDIWAFGCILYQFLVGKPPFRGATDYLTFQKILKKDMEYPEGFDEDAKALVDLVLNLDPTLRPSVQDIKSHPFFALTDFLTIWTVPAPPISTGLTKPVTTLANIDPSSDLWAVFDDEVSDGGFEYDRDEDSDHEPHQDQHVHEEVSNDHSREPRFDRHAAAHAVRNVDNPDSSVVHSPFDGPHVDLAEELGPPRPAYAIEGSQDRDQRKSRGWSHGSSSSGGNRTALSGWLEAMRIGGGGHGHGQGHVHGHGTRSSRTSRTSVRSDEYRAMMSSQSSMPSQSATPPPSVPIPPRLSGDLMLKKKTSGGSDVDKWSSLLLSNERIIFTSSILARTSSPSLHLPSFLLPASKRRQLILTDFPRLITVKDDTHIPASASHGSQPTSTPTPSDESPTHGTTATANANGGSLRVKGECVFVVRPSGATALSGHSGDGTSGTGTAGVANKVTDVQEKGGKGFVVQTAGTTYLYTAESAELRDRWLSTIRRVTGTGA